VAQSLHDLALLQLVREIPRVSTVYGSLLHHADLARLVVAHFERGSERSLAELLQDLEVLDFSEVVVARMQWASVPCISYFKVCSHDNKI